MYLLYRKIKINDYIKYMSDIENKLEELLLNYNGSYDSLLSKCPNLVLEYEGEDELTNLQRDYYQAVTDANNIIGTLTKAEEKYFEKKYGEKIYGHFTDLRDEYIKSATDCSDGNTIITSECDDGSGTTITTDVDAAVVDEKSHLYTYNQLFKSTDNINSGMQIII